MDIAAHRTEIWRQIGIVEDALYKLSTVPHSYRLDMIRTTTADLQANIKHSESMIALGRIEGHELLEALDYKDAMRNELRTRGDAPSLAEELAGPRPLRHRHTGRGGLDL